MPIPSKAATARTQTQVGSYHLVRLIAEGAIGQVYEVRHIELGRRAALKMLRPENAQNAETAARFFTEARAMSMAHHPGLAHVYEYGHMDDGGAYLVMELVEGETLRAYLERKAGKLPIVGALVLARQIAAAMQAAHDKGITHRDLKPENIGMVDRDSQSEESAIKILDFGLAKVSDAQASAAQTRPGQVLGTPLYMAPEQAGAPGGIGPHTDVYALGVLLFEMLCGEPPFTASQPLQLIGQHMFAEPPRLRSQLPEAAADLEHLLDRMLAKNTVTRPSMREVKEQLKRIERMPDRSRDAQPPRLREPADAPKDGDAQVATQVFRRMDLAEDEPTQRPGTWLRELSKGLQRATAPLRQAPPQDRQQAATLPSLSSPPASLLSPTRPTADDQPETIRISRMDVLTLGAMQPGAPLSAPSGSRQTARWVGLALLVLLALGAWLIWQAGSREPSPPAQADTPPQPTQPDEAPKTPTPAEPDPPAETASKPGTPPTSGSSDPAHKRRNHRSPQTPKSLPSNPEIRIVD